MTTTLVRTGATLLVSSFLAACGSAPPAPREVATTGNPESDPVLTCVESWPEARYRAYGYDHIVHLRSRCRVTADCTVTTDVSPEASRAVVRPAEHVEVLTFRGSPAREFTPTVVCRPAAMH